MCWSDLEHCFDLFFSFVCLQWRTLQTCRPHLLRPQQQSILGLWIKVGSRFLCVWREVRWETHWKNLNTLFPMSIPVAFWPRLEWGHSILGHLLVPPLLSWFCPCHSALKMPTLRWFVGPVQRLMELCLQDQLCLLCWHHSNRPPLPHPAPPAFKLGLIFIIANSGSLSWSKTHAKGTQPLTRSPNRSNSTSPYSPPNHGSWLHPAWKPWILNWMLHCLTCSSCFQAVAETVWHSGCLLILSPKPDLLIAPNLSQFLCASLSLVLHVVS